MGSPSPAKTFSATIALTRECDVRLLQNAINVATEHARVEDRGDGGPQPVLSTKSRAKGVAAAPSARLFKHSAGKERTRRIGSPLPAGA
jgi:hypothetical protein